MSSTAVTRSLRLLDCGAIAVRIVYQNGRWHVQECVDVDEWVTVSEHDTEAEAEDAFYGPEVQYFPPRLSPF